ncbi:MAG: cryptochrome/photolyase family protein [SAR86 cluster bacterium]|uniref:Cryptochrome/photolyase family protein n=1 Tax=SAR86 cluster bacterium TaxID=2030880 RepID=A0A520MJ08_9GAMM|nr:MAG: cryptochrome/photolyase family protein [SAR86 cluster bacterium]
MNTLGIILPDQLSFNNPVLSSIDDKDFLLLYEPMSAFYEIKSHKQKIVFLISALRHFMQKITHENILHKKIEKKPQSLDKYLKQIHDSNSFSVLYISKPSDFKTLKDLMYFCQSNNVELKVLEDKKFITTNKDFEIWSEGKKTTILEFYYRWLRKKHNILMTDDAKPIGDKWNLDKENRKGISKLSENIPKRKKIKNDDITIEVMIEVESIFPSSFGSLENFNWSVTHEGAKEIFKDFLDRFLPNFGSFQDAINKDNSFMFHSLLSPYLNAGLLDPMECIQEVEKRYLNPAYELPLNSVEGFIRQILGWREFIMGVYWQNMPQYKDLNFWSHGKNLSDSWYQGTTGIPPLDDAIKESIDYGYTHHINRLMIISNLMNLSGVNPNKMYQWFMEMYIDSADWVMVPNVYGMGSYADGGIFSTKPYICGSSYMLRMSNYKKGEWCDVVDGLYWRFIDKNIGFFEKNPRLSLMTRALGRLDKERKNIIFDKAEEFITNNTN